MPLGALCAPLVHAHVDGHDADHHPAHEIHAHFSDHSTRSTAAGGPRLQEDETGRPVYLQLFVAVAHACFDIPAAVATSWELGAPAESPARHSLHVAHGHDPPFLRSLQSRAPPAFNILI